LIDLGADRVEIGRRWEPESHMPPLRHPTVSRAHFAVEWDAESGTHVGTDLGSRNGVWIDGQAAGSGWHALVSGSLVRLGGVILVYEDAHTLAVADDPEVCRGGLPGDCPPMARLRSQLGRAAPDVAPVLVIGETGTGKEQVARELHRLSGRPGPFVAINCAALSAHLIESQLFGHTKGAFTGAVGDQAGLFRAAEGGTLFLDEIGELPIELQPKLLRAIQEREILPVGSNSTMPVDVRIVAATLRDLESRIADGLFRQDLFARLALWELQVPSLRRRRGDVLEWVDRFHEIWMHERGFAGRAPLRLTPGAASALVLHDWQDNLREVVRLVHELASVRLDEPIGVSRLPAWLRRRSTTPPIGGRS